jgi:hypothetical protein
MEKRTLLIRGLSLNPSKWAKTSRFGESARAYSRPVSLRRQGGLAGTLSKPACLDPLVILYKRPVRRNSDESLAGQNARLV